MKRLSRFWPALALVVITAIGLAFRLITAHEDVFADELATLWVSTRGGPGDVISTVYTDAEISPPLPFLAAWLSGQFGDGPVLLRLVSLAFGTATIPIVYGLGLRVMDRAGAAVAAAITALAPFMIFYSAEARGYALTMAFLTISTLAALIAVESRRTRWWILYAVAVCAAMYCHYTAVFVLIAQFAWIAWARPQARRPVLIASAAAAVAFAPWLPGVVRDFQSPTTDILATLQPFDLPNVRLSLVHWSISYPYGTVVSARDLPGTLPVIALLVGLAVAAGSVIAARRKIRPVIGREMLQRPGALIVLLALATPVGAALFSLTGVTKVFSTRNLAPSWTYFALALALLLASAALRPRVVASALVLICFAAGALKMPNDRYGRPRYSPAVDYIADRAAPGDVVIDETAVRSPGPLSHLDPLLEPSRKRVRGRASTERRRPFGVFDKVLGSDDAARVAAAAAPGKRVFAVTDIQGGDHLVGLPRGYRLVATRRFESIYDVIVKVYEPPPSQRG